MPALGRSAPIGNPLVTGAESKLSQRQRPNPALNSLWSWGVVFPGMVKQLPCVMIRLPAKR